MPTKTVVTAGEIGDAIERGKAISDDWRSGLVEIALIPRSVVQRFMEHREGLGHTFTMARETGPL